MAVLASLLLIASSKWYLAYPLLSTLLCSCVCNCHPSWWSYFGTGSRKGTSAIGRILSTCTPSLRLVLFPKIHQTISYRVWKPDIFDCLRYQAYTCGSDSYMLHDLKVPDIDSYDACIFLFNHEHSSVTPPCLPCPQLGATMVIFMFWLWKLKWGPKSAISWHARHVGTGLL